jgi:hypothetical protein
MGERIKEAIYQYYDNSLMNIGNWNSFAWCVIHKARTWRDETKDVCQPY